MSHQAQSFHRCHVRRMDFEMAQIWQIGQQTEGHTRNVRHHQRRHVLHVLSTLKVILANQHAFQMQSGQTRIPNETAHAGRATNRQRSGGFSRGSIPPQTHSFQTSSRFTIQFCNNFRDNLGGQFTESFKHMGGRSASKQATNEPLLKGPKLIFNFVPFKGVEIR